MITTTVVCCTVCAWFTYVLLLYYCYYYYDYTGCMLYVFMDADSRAHNMFQQAGLMMDYYYNVELWTVRYYVLIVCCTFALLLFVCASLNMSWT